MAALNSLDGALVYIDTNIVIYAIERSIPFTSAHVEFYRRVDAGRIRVTTSEITIAECLVKPLADNRRSIVIAYLDFLSGRPELPLIPIDRDVLFEAASLRAQTKLKLPDAIHAASAERAGCAAFLSNDRALKTPGPMRRIAWSSLTL